MKSLVMRNFMSYAMIIMLGFVLLAGIFTRQVDTYAQQEKQAVLDITAERAADSTRIYLLGITAAMQASELIVDGYLVNMSQLAEDSGGIIYVADANGNLAFVANEDNCYMQEGGIIPEQASEQLLTTGEYSAHSNFYGYLSTPHYIKGETIRIGSQMAGMIFVCVPSEEATALFLGMSQTFLILTSAILFFTLLTTVIVARRTLDPLKQMAAATRRFARGDFGIRVPLPRYQDELYDMTISFNNMANAIENMEQNRRGLIANVSHDLRTPMTTIAGFVDGMADGTIKQDKWEHYLRIISDEVKRLSRMANSMLELSRLEANDEQLAMGVMDMSEIVRRVVISFERAITDKKLELLLEIPETLPITANHDGLFQVVYNLFDNAIKYTAEGQAITIYMSEKGGKLDFHIVNASETIPKESLTHIFDRFYKVDQSRTDGQSGSGLGLYIVRTIIRKHGGETYASSGQGKTEFSFEIPTTPPKSKEGKQKNELA